MTLAMSQDYFSMDAPSKLWRKANRTRETKGRRDTGTGACPGCLRPEESNFLGKPSSTPALEIVAETKAIRANQTRA
jgi:hypothetical protein